MAGGQRSPITRFWRGGALAAVLAAALVAIYVTQDEQGNVGDGVCAGAATRAAALDPLAVGELAAFNVAKTPQALSALAFNDADDAATTLAAFEGRVALVNLWATWCAPCRAEMPSLDRLQESAGGDDFVVVPISIDTGGRERPQQFLENIGVEHLPLYTDPSTKIFEAMKSRGLAVGLPVTALIDGDGCLLGHINGPAEWDSEDARKLIDAAIGANGSETNAKAQATRTSRG